MGLENGYSPEAEYEKKELIEKALESLPERERTVLECRFFKQMTLQETADQMGIKYKERVRQIQLLALRRLKLGGILSEEILNQFENFK